MKLSKTENSHSDLSTIINKVYKECSLEVSNFQIEVESKEYYACRFNLNKLKIISRTAKITPKKVGQFVTFWKREVNQPIAPFDENDAIDFFVVNIQNEKQLGQFVFPKSLLVKKGIISTAKKEGKRAFRVYPAWDVTESKQAIASQKWQVNYFYEINENMDLKSAIDLYKI